MTDTELSSLEAAAKAATPGPWNTKEGPDFSEIFAHDKNIALIGSQHADAAYIAAANPASILELVQELKQAKNYISELEEDSRVYAKRIGEISELLDIEHDAGSLAELSYIFHSVERLQEKLRQAQAERDFILEQVDDMFDADDLLRAAREASKND